MSVSLFLSFFNNKIIFEYVVHEFYIRIVVFFFHFMVYLTVALALWQILFLKKTFQVNFIYGC